MVRTCPAAGPERPGAAGRSAPEHAPPLLELLGADPAPGNALAEGRHRGVVGRFLPCGARHLAPGRGVPKQPPDPQDDQDDQPDRERQGYDRPQQRDDAKHSEVSWAGERDRHWGQARTMIRSSVMSSIAQRRPSRPRPESLTPPYGMWSIR